MKLITSRSQVRIAFLATFSNTKSQPNYLPGQADAEQLFAILAAIIAAAQVHKFEPTLNLIGRR
jgi:hypothetical protein